MGTEDAIGVVINLEHKEMMTLRMNEGFDGGIRLLLLLRLCLRAEA